MESPSKLEVAYNYMYAVQRQAEAESKLNEVLRLLNPDNQIMGTCDAIETAYTDMVARYIGPHMADWLSWYMWEADFGKSETLKYWVDGVEYSPKEQSFIQFWHTVNT